MGDICLQALCQLLNSACNNAGELFFCTLNHLFCTLNHLKGAKAPAAGPNYTGRAGKNETLWCALCKIRTLMVRFVRGLFRNHRNIRSLKDVIAGTVFACPTFAMLQLKTTRSESIADKLIEAMN